jgi:recombination protein RecA
VYGSPETTPGGNGVKFAASIRVDIRKDEMLSENEAVFGQKTRYTIIKNKTAPPLKKNDMTYYIDGEMKGQIDNHQALAAFGIEMGRIVKTGSWFAGDWLKKKVQGEDNLGSAFRGYAKAELNKMLKEVQEQYLGKSPLTFRF